jgi:hypothetical protein
MGNEISEDIKITINGDSCVKQPYPFSIREREK